MDDISDNPPTPIQVRIGRELTQDDITDNSTQFFNPENNHIYEYVNSNVDIGQAKEIAEEYLFSSKYSGHIHTVDSENERLLFSGTGDSNNFYHQIENYVGVSWLGIHLENNEWVYSSSNSDLTSTVDFYTWGGENNGGYLWAKLSSGNLDVGSYLCYSNP